mgnify:CR=1 FL=1
MDERKTFIALDTDRYENLISRSTKLSMLEKAYKDLKSYEFENLVKVFFGEKEEAC